MYSIILTLVPLRGSPPPNTPLVGELLAASCHLTALKSPKSVVLPVLAIVTYCITFIDAEPLYPPPNTPLVVEDKPAPCLNVPEAKSPKSVALPALAKVT